MSPLTFGQDVPCSLCHGTGQLLNGRLMCEPCGGTGLSTRDREASTGRELRDRGVEAVQKPERTRSWQASADRALVLVISRGPQHITSEDVWHELERFDIPRPADPRAMGAVMRRALRLGLVAPTNMFASSTRASRHAGPVRLYRVLGQPEP